MKAQATQMQPAQLEQLVQSSMQALTLANTAVEQARAVFTAAGFDLSAMGVAAAPANVQQQPAANLSANVNNSKASGGRLPSAEQVAIRSKITEWCSGPNAGLFTNKSMVDMLGGGNKIPVRNAINALTDQGIIVRYAEKFPNGLPGAREIIYRPANFTPAF